MAATLLSLLAQQLTLGFVFERVAFMVVKAGLLLLLLVSGCESPWDADLRDVQQRQSQAEARLRDTLSLIAQAEERAGVAARRAQLFECRAQVMNLAAEAAEIASRCALAHTNFAQCQARIAKQSADNTLLGCAMGIAAAVASGGAAAPYAVAGCGLGRVAGDDEGNCDEVECDSSSHAALRGTLARHGLAELPMCGGEMGVTVEPVASIGLAVEKVEEGSAAAEMGMKSGDTLLTLQGQRVTRVETLAAVLSTTPKGAPLFAAVYRAGRRLDLSGRRRDDIFGVYYTPTLVEVPTGFVRITKVSVGTGAEAAGLRPGDLIVQVGQYADISEVETAYSAIRLLEEGAQVPVLYWRSDQMHKVTVTLGRRTDPHAL